MKRGSTYILAIFLMLAVLPANAQDDDLPQFGSADTFDVLQWLRMADDGRINDEAVLEALHLARFMQYDEGVKKALSILVNREIGNGDSESALRHALEWQGILEKENQPRELSKVISYIGEIYDREGIYPMAIPYYQKALTAGQGQLSTSENARIGLLIGRAALQAGWPKEAIEWLTKVHLTHSTSSRFEDRVHVQQLLARAEEQSGNYEKALSYYRDILREAANRDDRITQAIASNNIGFTCHKLGQYDQAVLAFEAAEKYATPHPEALDLTSVYVNHAIALNQKGDFAQAMTLLEHAKNTPSDHLHHSYIEHLESTLFLKKGDIYNALKYNEIALKNAQMSGKVETLCDAYSTASEIFQELFEYEKALGYYRLHLHLRDSLLLREKAARQAIDNRQYLLEKTEKEVRLQLANQELQRSELYRVNLLKDKLQLEKEKLLLDAERREKENEVLLRDKRMQEADLRNAELQAEQTRQTLALTQQRLLASAQQQQIADLSQKEQKAKWELEKQKADEATNRQQILLLQNQQKIDELELSRQRSFRRNAYGIGTLLGVILLLTFVSGWYSRRLNRRLKEQNAEIEAQKQAIGQERNRAESLLRNVLPEVTARELQLKGSSAPRKYDLVSVLFTDFADFTRIAETMPPETLIEVLNSCFSAFDAIAEHYHLEKIKTIGDSYMCAGGLPHPNATNPIDAVSAALAIRSFMEEFNVRQKRMGKPVFAVRIGIHSGEVAAGVIGQKKFAYDVWGDTVNVASRLESNCPSGQINISESTYQKVSHRFDCQYRGKIHVKNKGEMGMYLVQKPRQSMTLFLPATEGVDDPTSFHTR